jgi:hypothetical protein
MINKITIKTIRLIIFITVFISCNGNNVDCAIELEEKDNLIEELNEKIVEMEDELKDLINDKSHNSEYENNVNQLSERKIALLEEQLMLQENKILKMEVFYSMIEDSEFKDCIESYTYRDYQKPLLNKVYVKIEGTDKIIKFYSHLYSQYHWLYLRNNIK